MCVCLRDVKRFKDVRKEFERSSETLEAALGKNAQAPRGKQHEVEDASQALLNARRAFRSVALDYVLQVYAHTHTGMHTCYNAFTYAHALCIYAHIQLQFNVRKKGLVRGDNPHSHTAPDLIPYCSTKLKAEKFIHLIRAAGWSKKWGR